MTDQVALRIVVCPTRSFAVNYNLWSNITNRKWPRLRVGHNVVGCRFDGIEQKRCKWVDASLVTFILNWEITQKIESTERRPAPATGVCAHTLLIYAFHCSKSHTRTHTPPPAPPPPLLLTETLKTLAHLFSSIRGSDSDISFVHFLCNQTDFNWYFVHFLRGREFAAGRVCHR